MISSTKKKRKNYNYAWSNTAFSKALLFFFIIIICKACVELYVVKFEIEMMLNLQGMLKSQYKKTCGIGIWKV